MTTAISGRTLLKGALALGAVLIAVSFALFGGGTRSAFDRSFPGKRTGNAVVFKLSDGRATLYLTAKEHLECGTTEVCLYENSQYNHNVDGVHWDFNCTSCGWQNLSGFGFNNKMSSWVNNRGTDAQVSDFADGNGSKLCLNANSSNSYVGDAWNDRASAVKVYTTNGICV